MRPFTRFALGLVAAFSSACDGEVTLDPCAAEGHCACSPERTLPSGVCCPAWTTAMASTGACIRRPFSVPSASDAIGAFPGRFASTAIDGRGLAILAWDERPDLALSRVVVGEEIADGSFALREPGPALSGDPINVRIAAGPGDHAIVAWRQGAEASPGVFVSERRGGAWTDPADDAGRFSWIEEIADRPHVVIAETGEAIVVWDQWIGEHFGVQMARRPTADSPWIMPEAPTDVLSPLIFFSNQPRLAMNARGDGLVSWFQAPVSALMAYASARDGQDGAFERPAADAFISPPGAPVDQHIVANPRPALAPNGEGIVAWTQEDGAGSILVFTATRSPDGVWTRPADLASSFSAPPSHARCVIPIFGPRGDLYLTWFEDRGKGYEVVLAHRAPDGRWIDTGTSPRRLSTPGLVAITPAIAVGPDGGVLVAWSEEQADGSWRIAARRGGSGDAPWGPIEPLSPDGEGDATDPSVAVGGANDRGLVTWTQGAFEAQRVFVARVE